MIVRWPGHVPAGRQSAALQTLTDLTPTWLDCLGLPVPMTMSGCSQRAVWCGDEAQARQHVVVENRHQPSTCHLVTYIEQRYKITVYGDMDDGELFDLEQDPGEQRNLWHSEAAALLKSHLLLRLNQGQMQAQPLYMPRIAGA